MMAANHAPSNRSVFRFSEKFKPTVLLLPCLYKELLYKHFTKMDNVFSRFSNVDSQMS